MHISAVARALAQHRTGPAAPPPAPLPMLPRRPPHHALLAAITREVRQEPRTVLEMARDREGSCRPWQHR